MQTNGGGSHGGDVHQGGLGTLLVTINNGQLDDPFKLDRRTVIVESARLARADTPATRST
jgi:hypothetical protein